MGKLLFLEGSIYQTDEEYEENHSNSNLISEPITSMRDVFNQLDLWDEELERLLQKGIFYWQIEQKFCSGVACTESELREAMINRSFDMWMLHHLLSMLTGSVHCVEFSELILINHQITEILYDLDDYHQDLSRNTFNSYRVFIYLYAENAEHCLNQHLDKLDKQLHQQIQKFEQVKPDLAQKYLEQLEVWYQKYPLPAIPEPIWEFSKVT